MCYDRSDPSTGFELPITGPGDPRPPTPYPTNGYAIGPRGDCHAWTLSVISNESVASARSQGLDRWLDVLDDRDTDEFQHMAIVAPFEDAGINSG